MLAAFGTDLYHALSDYAWLNNPNRIYTVDLETANFIDYMFIHDQLFAPEHLVKRVTNCLSQQTRSRMTRFAS